MNEYKKICVMCGNEFTTNNMRTVCCSAECKRFKINEKSKIYSAAHREEQKIRARERYRAERNLADQEAKLMAQLEEIRKQRQLADKQKKNSADIKIAELKKKGIEINQTELRIALQTDTLLPFLMRKEREFNLRQEILAEGGHIYETNIVGD